MRSDRVLAFPAPPRQPGTRGRSPRHGARFAFADPQSWPTPAHTTTTDTTRYGTAHARSWDRLHPKLTHTGAWTDHDGPLPVMEGTVIRLHVERLPGTGTPKPLWLWYSATATTADTVDRLWQMFLRRFDLEHTFRFLKQTMGWTTPRVRTPEAADRWTWLMIAAHTQLRLARHLVEDLPRPWERKPATPARLPPRPGPTGISRRSTGNRVACQHAEILPTRPWTSSRITKLPPSPAPRPRQDHQNGHQGLNNKLRACRK